MLDVNNTAKINPLLTEKGHLFEISKIEDLNVSHLFNKIEQEGYASIRGLFPKDELRKILQQIKTNLDTSKDNPAVGDNADSAMNNFQKLVVGGGAQTTYYVPRCVRVIYNPIWADNIYGMRDNFIRLGQLRNHIQGNNLNYAIHSIEQDGFWTGARLQHYPTGAGFFMSHQDSVLSQHTQDAGLKKFIQILLLITQRGEDFDTGGAFVEHIGEHLDLEAELETGDVVIYDGRSVHGVCDIDPHKSTCMNSASGRIVALASLYTDMTKSKEEYEHYRNRIY